VLALQVELCLPCFAQRPPKCTRQLRAVSAILVALLCLLRDARAGRARLALATGLLVLASPWVLLWYAVWIVPVSFASCG